MKARVLTQAAVMAVGTAIAVDAQTPLPSVPQSLSLDDACSRVVEAVSAHGDGNVQDDVTLLGVEYRGMPRRRAGDARRSPAGDSR